MLHIRGSGRSSVGDGDVARIANNFWENSRKFLRAVTPELGIPVLTINNDLRTFENFPVQNTFGLTAFVRLLFWLPLAQKIFDEWETDLNIWKESSSPKNAYSVYMELLIRILKEWRARKLSFCQKSTFDDRNCYDSMKQAQKEDSWSFFEEKVNATNNLKNSLLLCDSQYTRLTWIYYFSGRWLSFLLRYLCEKVLRYKTSRALDWKGRLYSMAAKVPGLGFFELFSWGNVRNYKFFVQIESPFNIKEINNHAIEAVSNKALKGEK